MDPIPNPTPLTATAPFDRLWVSSLAILADKETGKIRIFGTLLPYNGTQILATPRHDLRIQDALALATTDASFAACQTALIGELKRQSILKNLITNTDEPWFANVSVQANDPSRPVRISAIIEIEAGRKFLNIPNAFALATTDAIFAEIFAQVMGEIGRQVISES